MEEEKKYYYLEDNQKIGPLTFTELKLSVNKRNTMVWYPGLADWKPAHEIDILQFKFPDLNQFKNEEEIRGSRKIQEVSVKVWKSRGFKDAPTIFMFFFLFFGFMGSLLVGAGESNEKGFGVVIVVLGIIFLGLFILFKTKGIGKEDYRIGLNYQDGTLWVNRPSKKKMLKEEWAGKIVKFHMVKTKNSRMITGRGPGGVPRRVVDTIYELQVSLSGRDYLWPVPGSVFFSKKDANAVLNQVNYLL